jgi:hypothetical protein
VIGQSPTSAPPQKPSGGAGSSEASLDLEMANSLAPAAQVIASEGSLLDSQLNNVAANNPNVNFARAAHAFF